jgi:hypothetical protein
VIVVQPKRRVPVDGTLTLKTSHQLGLSGAAFAPITAAYCILYILSFEMAKGSELNAELRAAIVALRYGAGVSPTDIAAQLHIDASTGR